MAGVPFARAAVRWELWIQNSCIVYTYRTSGDGLKYYTYITNDLTLFSFVVTSRGPRDVHAYNDDKQNIYMYINHYYIIIILSIREANPSYILWALHLYIPLLSGLYRTRGEEKEIFDKNMYMTLTNYCANDNFHLIEH